MSKGKAWGVDHYTKELVRRLDYIQAKVILRELQLKLATPLEPRLTLIERRHFKQWLWWKYGPNCAYCQRSYDLRYCMTIDHIQPRSKGGAMRDIQNMALSCRECNEKKGNSWQE